MAQPVLGYWSFRGLGNTCRLTLAAAKVDYEPKTYDFATKEEWFEQAKPELA